MWGGGGRIEGKLQLFIKTVETCKAGGLYLKL